MAVQKSTSNYLAQLQKDPEIVKAAAKHKNDKTTLGSGGDLPDGIEGGVAQLTQIKIEAYKSGDMKGKLFFSARAIVKVPEEYKGLATQIGPEPLCATPNRKKATKADHVAWVQNELRKLGCDPTLLDVKNWGTLFETLLEEKPHIRFRTWKGEATATFKNPRVQHDWRGLDPNFVSADGDDGVDETLDESAEDDSSESTEEVDESSEEGSEESGGDANLEALGEQADAGDEEAIDKLTELAGEAGIDPDTIGTWAELATMLSEAGGEEEVTDDDGSGDDGSGEPEEGGEEDAEATEPDATKPEKGDVFKYTPKNKKKAVECEVVLVNPVKKWVTLKSVEGDDTLYKGVPFSALK